MSQSLLRLGLTGSWANPYLKTTWSLGGAVSPISPVRRYTWLPSVSPTACASQSAASNHMYWYIRRIDYALTEGSPEKATFAAALGIVIDSGRHRVEQLKFYSLSLAKYVPSLRDS